MITSLVSSRTFRSLLLTIGTLCLIAGLLLLASTSPVVAQDEPSVFHPVYALLDADGRNVVETGNPVSTMKTCGSCHDTEFIAGHSFHADVGLSNFGGGGATTAGHTWDSSSGYFGNWNPLTYRYLSPTGDVRVDLTTAEWLQVFGARHVGGGPAVTARDGRPLTEVAADTTNIESSIIDPATGEAVPWDWNVSGVVEMNCFLCHSATPNNDARVEALQAGEFAWANSATLLGSSLITREGENWQWNAAAFDAEGNLLPEYVTIGDPRSDACGQCHGSVHLDAQVPLVFETCSVDDWRTYTTGQVISPQRVSNSGMNIEDKSDVTRSWDVHAERVLNCNDCHFSLNNPVRMFPDAASQPDHLLFDPRRIDFGEYLLRPLHQFAKGENAQSVVAPEYSDTLRRCDSCHSLEATHDWLPYKERHVSALACESCHVPKLYAPALESLDWTVLDTNGQPIQECRGAGSINTNNPAETFVTGYEPVLLTRRNADGSESLAPFNVVAVYYWVYGDPARPVPLRDLQAVWLQDEQYAPEILAAFDSSGDGTLDAAELQLDSDAKVQLIASRLEARGLSNPQIVGDVQPYDINHNIATGEWAVRDCQTCHGDDSRMVAAFSLGDRAPGNTLPTLNSPSTNISWNGSLTRADDGTLLFQPSTQTANLYVFGHSRVDWIDTLGALMFLGMLLGVSVHGGLRYMATRRMIAAHGGSKMQRMYMYAVYERFWHWLQTVVILGLVFTGLVIHRPNTFGAFSFPFVVEVHNILAAILVVNAALSAFYHLVSGEIRQYIPRPYGFFDQAFSQVKYYLNGIFRGAPHPFERTPESKLNPLQQITYLLILNVLLPLQIVTGALMWGAQRWREVADLFGGLPVLSPVHTAVAWLFATFIVLHVYLTTTGHTPLAGIKAMMLGWDDVEVSEQKPVHEGGQS